MLFYTILFTRFLALLGCGIAIYMQNNILLGIAASSYIVGLAVTSLAKAPVLEYKEIEGYDDPIN